jgi:hypothetical protein
MRVVGSLFADVAHMAKTMSGRVLGPRVAGMCPVPQKIVAAVSSRIGG